MEINESFETLFKSKGLIFLIDLTSLMLSSIALLANHSFMEAGIESSAL